MKTDKRIAIVLTNYNMPERTDALFTQIATYVQWPHDIFVVDNGSDLVEPARFTNVKIEKNVQTTGGWLAGLNVADANEAHMGFKYFAYWFLITSAEYPDSSGDVLSPMAQWLVDNPDAAGIHPALTADSTTSWKHLITRGGDKPRRTWMLDNIASLYRADFFNRIGRFDPALRYGWGVDLETSFKARMAGYSLWVDERVQIRKITDIGYTMRRMNMTAEERQVLAGVNMGQVLGGRYGSQWWQIMTQCGVQDEWK